MYSRVAPVFALACVAAALAGCDASRPLAPDTADEIPAVKDGSGINAPSGLASAAAPPNQIDLAWRDNSSNENGFEVHRSVTGPSGTFTLRAMTSANVISYGDAGLGPSTQYCYRVRAFTASGKNAASSAFTNTSCATPSGVPAAPSNINASPETSTSVSVTWTDNSANEDGFRVERSSDDGASWSAVLQTSADATRSVDDARTAESPRLCYRVVAYNGFGTSAPSGTDCTTPPAGAGSLTASVSDQAIILSWTDNSVVEDGYEVQRAAIGEPYKVVAILPANATGYHDAQATVDVTYWYYVRATKDGGFSYPSNFVHATVATRPPPAPSGTDAYPSGSARIQVNWTYTAGTEDGLRIERSTDGGTSWQSVSTANSFQSLVYDDGRTVEQQVCYRVLAFNGKGDSAPSNVDCTSTTPGPTNLNAKAVDPLTVDLTWTDNSSSEDGYTVLRYHDLQESGPVIAELPPNSTSYHDAQLSFGPGEYTYWVMANKDGGVSDDSNPAGVSTTPASSTSSTAVASPRRQSPSSAARVRLSTRTRVGP
jgi:fibronectin type 3 domain-containing protein